MFAFKLLSSCNISENSLLTNFATKSVLVPEVQNLKPYQSFDLCMEWYCLSIMLIFQCIIPAIDWSWRRNEIKYRKETLSVSSIVCVEYDFKFCTTPGERVETYDSVNFWNSILLSTSFASCPSFFNFQSIISTIYWSINTILKHHLFGQRPKLRHNSKF